MFLVFRTDLGLYSIFEKNKFIEYREDLVNYPPWKDMVTFYIGCSLSFEKIAENAGIPFRNVIEGKIGAIFVSNIPLASVGTFKGTILVSMRPCQKSALEKMVQVIAPHEVAHGAPVHIGDPAMIGITDIINPDVGVSIDIKEDEVPVFWASSGSVKDNLMNASKYLKHLQPIRIVRIYHNSRAAERGGQRGQFASCLHPQAFICLAYR